MRRKSVPTKWSRTLLALLLAQRWLLSLRVVKIESVGWQRERLSFLESWCILPPWRHIIDQYFAPYNWHWIKCYAGIFIALFNGLAYGNQRRISAEEVMLMDCVYRRLSAMAAVLTQHLLLNGNIIVTLVETMIRFFWEQIWRKK